jgi:hypothetical protein
MPEIDEKVSEALESTEGEGPEEERGPKKFNSIIAAAVAVSATILAVGNVKAGNVDQAMAKSQIDVVDEWGYYQAKSTKQALAEASLEQLTLQRDGTPNLTADQQAQYAKAIASYKARVDRYEKEKAEITAKVEALEKRYDELNVKDDQFDIAEALISVGIALFGITALTQRRWMIFVALAFAGFGAIVSMAGFIGWNLRPEWLVKVIGV